MNHHKFSPIKDLRPDHDSRPNKRRFERTSFRERANHGHTVVKAAVLPPESSQTGRTCCTSAKIISAEGIDHLFDRRSEMFSESKARCSVVERERRMRLI
jgi:RNA:NAD 2'-phosphotransferase (TPT1/KptA family)